VRFWRRGRRPSAVERALDERREQISEELVERGMDDLDQRRGLLGRLERSLNTPERKKRKR
jgi:hypothetical protein